MCMQDIGGTKDQKTEYAYCNEMPRQEIADRMGMSLNAVMSTLTRIKDWIRKKYKDEFDHINT